MKYKERCSALMVAALVMQLTVAAQERRIEKSELPAAVQKAMEQETAGLTIRGYSSEVEDGQQEYEVETVKNGHTRDVSFAPDGRVLEEEEQVELTHLPTKVGEALAQKAGTGKIIKIESIRKKGKLVAYEAKGNKGGKRFEIQVGPEGESLAHEE